MDLISEDKLRYIAGNKKFNIIFLEKDYILTLLLFLIKDVKGLFFKGGTALNKIFLKHTRLSEDLDFSSNKSAKAVKSEIEKALAESKNIFTKIGTDIETEEFTRLKIYYKSYFQVNSSVAIDINKKASILLEPEKYKVPNFYGLNFEITTLNLKEILAEKVRAIITRNRPRDYFDMFFILKKYAVDMQLVRRKVKDAGEIYDAERIFKNASRIYSKWDEDIIKLTDRKLSFVKCIKFLEKKLR